MTRCDARSAVTRHSLTAAILLFGLVPSARGQQDLGAELAEGDAMRGWRTFHKKNCVDCHAIWGQGSRVGPDLGRIRAGRLSNGRLAGVMWNHIPKMRGWMKQMGRPPTSLSEEEMADLFALIFFVRQLDSPGDPLRGEEILRSKGCSECHTTDAEGGSIGPDLAQWGRYANPVIWAQLMWEHAPMMEEAMQRSGMSWPKLEGADLVHIVAYVRSVGISGEKAYLRPGAVARGRLLFEQKACDNCHPGKGPDLAASDLPPSVGALASRMWNHSPEMARAMREEEVARVSLDAQELADILAYVLALSAEDRLGDSMRGGRLFKQKGCDQCHSSEELLDGGPTVDRLGEAAAPVSMAAAMWNHGETMLELMTEAGISWPVFHDDEMVHLLAYLRSLQPATGEVGEASPREE